MGEHYLENHVKSVPCESLRATRFSPCRAFDASLEDSPSPDSPGLALRTSLGRLRRGDSAERIVSVLGMPSEICDSVFTPDAFPRGFYRHYIYETEKFWLSVDFDPVEGRILRSPRHDRPELKVLEFTMAP